MAACGGGDDEEAESTTTTAPAVQGADMVTIDMTDYAFNVSGPLTAGGMLKISNNGRELHELGMGKLKPGKTLDDLRSVLAQAGPPGGGGGSPTTAAGGTRQGDGDIRQQTGATTSTTASGRSAGQATTTTTSGQAEEPDPTAEILDRVGFPGGFLSPGSSVEITAPNLSAGTYALVCFFPTEGEGTPHIAKGMVHQLEVVEGAAPPMPTADATYRLTPGQAIEGPATLTSGSHTLKIDAAPGSQAYQPTLVKLNSGTTVSAFGQAVERLFTTEPLPKGAADQLPGEVVYAGFPLGGVTSFTLTTDFTAGNYALVASQEDAEGPPEEFINIRVT